MNQLDGAMAADDFVFPAFALAELLEPLNRSVRVISVNAKNTERGIDRVDDAVDRGASRLGDVHEKNGLLGHGDQALKRRSASTSNPALATALRVSTMRSACCVMRERSVRA